MVRFHSSLSPLNSSGGIHSWMLAVFCISIVFSCSASANEEKLVVVCSTTQTADFARQIVGDRWEVQCVLGPGEDPHTYEVGTDDVALVARADLCLQNGWNLEGHGWMKDLAETAGKPIVSCIEGVKPLDLNLKEGGQTVKDPHAWFDPKNAVIYVNNITEAVCKIDPDGADGYRERSDLYTRQLRLLSGWIKKSISDIPANQRVLITHHDAFGYFCNAFEFKPVSPVGWTTGEFAEVTLGARKGIIDQIRDSGVNAVFIETSTNEQLIEEIARDAGVKVGGKLYSDAMGPEDSAGETYIGMMRENVLTIKQALRK